MSFTCPACGAESHNPNDERERFCGRCKQWSVHGPIAISMWTIYLDAKDYPGQYVARRFVVGPGTVSPTTDVMVRPLPDLRDALARRGLVHMARNDGDEPQIVETWI